MRLRFSHPRFWLFAAVVTAWPAGAPASGFWMKDAELRASFAGSTIDGQYADRRTFRESYSAAGSIEYHEQPTNKHWTGHWSVVRDRFCTIYDNFGTGGCFRVRRVSLNCFEFYFDTRTEEEARRSTLRNPKWTARAWLIDHTSTCEERPMV